ncbi:MAG: hypothetical protein KF805_14090 [Phycisphaeraceae bacterium]|nr:hypothetical protein [Phycisphaeraceae bacterium]
MHTHESPRPDQALITRRTALIVPALGFACAAMGTNVRAGVAPAASPDSTGSWPHFPHTDPKLVAEVVGKSHFDENRVRELVNAHPPLVNAWWDWGFGDWESPLGAASHTGRREIALFLIERGARMDIFAAAMLGYTDVVKAFVVAQPGVQRTLGPHCIPLLAHAKVGGAKAKDTLEYLTSLGDAGNVPEVKPITEAEMKRLVGVYSYGPEEADRIEITMDDRGFLLFQKAGDASKNRIHSIGNNEFFPAGVPTTKVAFDLAKSPSTLTIAAGPLTVVATRTLGI